MGLFFRLAEIFGLGVFGLLLARGVLLRLLLVGVAVTATSGARVIGGVAELADG